MKRAALAIAVGCLIAACDSNDDTDFNRFVPTAPAVAPQSAEGPQNPPPPGTPLHAPPGNSAPTLVLRQSANVEGNGTIRLFVDMCRSSDPDNDHLNYKYLWGDGFRNYEEHAGFCSLRHSYGPGLGRRRVIACVDDGWPDHEVCESFFVTIP